MKFNFATAINGTHNDIMVQVADNLPPEFEQLPDKLINACDLIPINTTVSNNLISFTRLVWQSASDIDLFTGRPDKQEQIAAEAFCEVTNFNSSAVTCVNNIFTELNSLYDKRVSNEDNTQKLVLFGAMAITVMLCFAAMYIYDRYRKSSPSLPSNIIKDSDSGIFDDEPAEDGDQVRLRMQ